MKARFKKHVLNFKRPSGTSRGVLRQKESYFIELRKGTKVGIGECGLLRGLSIDDVPEYKNQLTTVCAALMQGKGTTALCEDFPSIQMGVEMALKSLDAETPFSLYPSSFSKGKEALSINGLVWMGSLDFMREQVFEKIAAGFDCIKLKVGALDFDKECTLLADIRARYSADELTIRVDANGAFSPTEVQSKLQTLAGFDLHSIEQPIAAGQQNEHAKLCTNTPIPIALDEELIGIKSTKAKAQLLDTIKPQFIILKPSLLGGFAASESWIRLAEERNIGWWVTSALESNVGLNAIAQWCATLNTTTPQGLGTGGLFTNNINSPLVVEKGVLRYDNALTWEYPF